MIKVHVDGISCFSGITLNNKHFEVKEVHKIDFHILIYE